MEVNAVCRERISDWENVVLGELAPAAAANYNQIDLLEDLSWSLAALQTYAQIRSAFIRQFGALSTPARREWDSIVATLSQIIPREELPTETIARDLLGRITRGRAYSGRDQDLRILNELVTGVESFLNDFRAQMTANDHPSTVNMTYDERRNFFINVRQIIDAVVTRLRSAWITIDVSALQWDNRDTLGANAATVIAQVNELLASRCNALAASRPVIAPPVAPPPVEPPQGETPPTTPPPPPPVPTRDHLWEFALEIAPLYSESFGGNGQSTAPTGPGLQSRVGIGINIRNDLRLQADWQASCYMESFDPFWTHACRDTYNLMLTQGDNLFQGGFTMARRHEMNPADSYDEHLGVFGYGREVLDGSLTPYVLGMIGTDSFGAVIGGAEMGLRGRYMHDSGFGIVGDIHYAILGGRETDHIIRGSIAAAYCVGDFWHSEFCIEAGVMGGYDSRSGDFDFGGILRVSIRGVDFNAPLPVPGE